MTRIKETISLRSLLMTGTIALLVSSLSGCSGLFGQEGYFRDRGDDYLKAEEMAIMKLPEGVDAGVIQPLYVIPRDNSTEFDLADGDVFEVPRPQPLAANMLSEKVKIQKLGDKRWVLINTPASEAWPRVRNFLSGNGLQVVLTSAEQGLIETAWLKFTADELTRHRYRIRIEQGVQPDSTEIHILHASELVSEELAANKPWPSASSDSEKESWMIDELAGVLASEESGAATSLMAQTIGVGAKVDFGKDGREPLLIMALEASRAWATVGHSVRNGGFTLLDEDSDKSIFYVAYVSPHEEGGWFSSLWGGGEKESADSPYSLIEVLNNLRLEDSEANRTLFSDEIVSNAQGGHLQEVPGLLVLVSQDEQLVKVRVRDALGRPLLPKQAKRLLTIMRRNLI